MSVHARHSRLSSLLKNPKDLPMLFLVARASLLLPLAALLFWRFSWLLAGAYLALYAGVLLEPFITMYHDTNHSRLFKRRYEYLNLYLDWILAPLLGFPPEIYYVHHVGMHHPEENLPADVSSTLAYRRDSFGDFARYYIRFFFCHFQLAVYFYRKRRTALLRRFLSGVIAYTAVVTLAMCVHWQAALVVFLLPLFIGRSALIIGNWGEHAFVDPQAPENLFRASTNLIGDKVNARCFNVGYHIGHHLHPMMHFTEMPATFEADKPTYGREDALVLANMHYPAVWFHLMTKNYRKLARAYVQLPGAPRRSEDELIALLRSRVVAVPKR
jgi:fatty acid desaturase